MGRLDNKIAIVTGAGQGIGRGIAAKLAAEGATVVVTDLNETTAEDTAAEIGHAIGIHADVTSRESVEAMVEHVHQQFGRIDVLVNNAGWDKAGSFVESDPADWDRVIAINLYGVLHTCRAALPIMATQNSGSVVNLASDAGRVGSSGEAVYSAAKGGVIAFTKATAREMARHQVNANCVCPGPTDTALFASMGGDNPTLREASSIWMRRRPHEVYHMYRSRPLSCGTAEGVGLISETPLAGVTGWSAAQVERLAEVWITTAEQVVALAATPSGVRSLAEQLGIDERAVSELIERAEAAVPPESRAELATPVDPRELGTGALPPRPGEGRHD